MTRREERQSGDQQGHHEKRDLLEHDPFDEGQAADGEYDQAHIHPHWHRPAQHERPERNRGKSEAEQHPEKALSHSLKWKMDGWRQAEGNVGGVVETLLIIALSRCVRIKRAAVVSGLNFARKFGGVRVSAM